MDTNAAHRVSISGPEIREEREEHGLTQEQMAEAMGLNRSTVSDYENRAFLKPKIVRRYREAITKLTADD